MNQNTLISNNIRSSVPPHFGVPDVDLIMRGDASRLRRYRLALILYLASVVMLFVGFSSAYIVRRSIATWELGTGAYAANWEALNLPVGLLVFNTVWLLLASVCLEVARRYNGAGSDRKTDRFTHRWILASLFSGLVFTAGQIMAWHVLRVGGSFLSSGAATAFFYVFTGTHFFHAVLGIFSVAFLSIGFRALSQSSRLLGIDLAAWYMHAMAALWIYLFCFLLWA